MNGVKFVTLCPPRLPHDIRNPLSLANNNINNHNTVPRNISRDTQPFSPHTIMDEVRVAGAAEGDNVIQISVQRADGLSASESMISLS